MLAIVQLLIGTTVAWSESLVERFQLELDQADSYRLRYFDPEAERRSVFHIGDVNGNKADFDVTVRCQWISCAHSTKFAGFLASAKETTGSCYGPPYARLDLIDVDGKIISTMYFDFRGTCISLEGKIYRLEESFITKLHGLPVRDW